MGELSVPCYTRSNLIIVGVRQNRQKRRKKSEKMENRQKKREQSGGRVDSQKKRVETDTVLNPNFY